jgi:PAT family beta-lactamase induction signal transducer AmpG
MSTDNLSQPAQSTWTAILNRRMLVCVFTGFASGMPLYLLIQLVPAWLRDSGVSLTEIGLFALVGLPYTWKFLWAPLMDRVKLPLGLRRGWMLLAQVALIVTIGLLGSIDPLTQTAWVATLAVIIAVLSATQDVAIDAYRRELLPDEELGFGNSVHVQAYRISSLIPGSLSLILADNLPWSQVFWITSAFMGVGVLLSLSVREPIRETRPVTNLRTAGTRTLFRVRSSPRLAEFHSRPRLLWCFISWAIIWPRHSQRPFYLDLGFSKTEIGLVAKNAALWPAIFGGLLGGVLMIRLGINRALWLFGAVQMASILGYAWLASMGTYTLDSRCGDWV